MIVCIRTVAVPEAERGRYLRWIAEGREKARGIPIKYGRDATGQPYVNRFAFASLYSDRLHGSVQRFRELAPLFGPGAPT